jgi:hypothetical protein
MSNFEHPTIDWTRADLFSEFRRFRDHVSFVFEGPLDEASDAQKAGWLGTWLGSTGREIFKTLTFADDADKKKANVILAKLEDYVRPRKNKRVA